MNEEWLGPWSVESIDRHSPEQHLAASLGSDRFVSWEYTFFDDGTFASKLSQDTGGGILVTTILGTYQVSGNRYTTETTSAAASMNTTSVAIPDAVGLNQAGTWSKAGDVLTLVPLGAPLNVLKRNYSKHEN